MTVSAVAHSNAFNFMSFLSISVDPRTGQYTVAIDLPELKSNDLCGPAVPLQLVFNPLNTLDSGFGIGWNLNLSQFTPHNSMLALATGETFKVTGSGPEPALKEKKLDSFHLYNDGNDRYRVVHKSGLIETLQTGGSANERVALPVELHAPSGHKVDLAYTDFNGGQRLQSISDALGRLLQINRSTDNARVEFLLHPDAGPGGTPLARFELKLTAGRVDEIVLPTEENARWRFDYQEVRGLTCIKEVKTPVGGRETIEYLDTGHAYPGNSGRENLPRVTRHRLFPGFEQPPMEVTYEYTLHNFIGNGANISWDNDGLDQLYKATSDYAYGSTASHKVDGKVVRTVQRTFNHFHLLTEETTIQGDCVQRVTTTYHTTAGSFEQQPAYFQLPKTVEKRWELKSDVTKARSETLSTTYDNFGNLLEELQHTGVRTVHEYYPATGGDGCPADPQGFVRNLRSKTVHPAEGHEGQAPVLRTLYRYVELPPLANSLDRGFLAVGNEDLVQIVDATGITLQNTRRHYLDMPDKPFLHGRPDRQEETLYDKDGKGKTASVSWRYSQVDGELGARTLHQTVETLTGYNGSQQVTMSQASRFNGETVLREDVDGVKTTYLHDALGRLLEERVALGTPVEACRSFTYRLTSEDGQQAEQVLTDIKGVQTRTLFDGGNRVIEEQRQQLDSKTGERIWRQTYTALHDALGRKASETACDWLNQAPLPLISHFDYDDWGEVYRVTGPDGVARISELWPFGDNGPIIRTWQEHAQRPDVRTQCSETHYNLFEKPDKVRRLDSQGNAAGSLDYIYDGHGNCVREVETLRNPQGATVQNLQRTTQYVYDVWGRMLRTVLPNEDEVERSFADFSISELPTRLQVTPSNTTQPAVVPGTQKFDDLERLTERTVGPRSEVYRYKDGQMQPHQRITPGNRTLTYRYNLPLTQEPTAITVAGAPESSYAYDPLSAAITQAINDQGQRDYEYTLEGYLASERWQDSNGVDQQTLHHTSLQGRQLRREDHGATPTQYQYDSAGRLAQVIQGGLQAEFGYNLDGLLERSTSANLDNDQRLVTELEYDEHGREIRRTLQVEGEAARVLTQVWQDDDQLRSRRLEKAGQMLLEEHFEYDTRNRLTRHSCAGEALPTDRYGNAITEQVFRFDALDNIERCNSRFADGSSDSARFTYDEHDRCQLREVSHSHSAYPELQTFDYDADGHQLNDEQGRRLRYDVLGRLLEVRSADDTQSLINYRYDGHDHLVGVRHGSGPEALRFYQGYQLSYTLQDDLLTQFLYDGDRALGQQIPDVPNQGMLLLTDAANSVIGESRADGLHEATYSAYGERREDNGLKGLLAFAGEVREAVIGWYLLGRGYRAYNPGLMRFHSPDSFSPFGAGGLNPYGYCRGNPIAWRDPSGHRAQAVAPRRDPDPGYIDPIEQPKKPGIGIGQWIGIGLAALFLVISAVALAPLTPVLTAAYVAAVVGVGLQVAGLGLQVYGTLTENDTFTQVGYGIGAVGGLLSGYGIVAARAAEAARKAANAAANAKLIVTTQKFGKEFFANGGARTASSTSNGGARTVSSTSNGGGTGGNIRAAENPVRQPSIPDVDYSSDSGSSTSSRPPIVGNSTVSAAPPPPAAPQPRTGGWGTDWRDLGNGKFKYEGTDPRVLIRPIAN